MFDEYIITMDYYPSHGFIMNIFSLLLYWGLYIKILTFNKNLKVTIHNIHIYNGKETPSCHEDRLNRPKRIFKFLYS